MEKRKSSEASLNNGVGRTTPPLVASPMALSDHSGEEERADPSERVDPSGRYVTKNELLGEGAFKKVYKALDEVEGKEVAWNEVQVQGRSFTAEERERIKAEIEIGTELQHPHIINFHESWVDEETKNVVFITELFTSGTLRQYRRKYTKLDVIAIKRWSRQILEGLAYLHDDHDPPVIHRDLKCDNIFINGHSGEVKIGDLGLATLLRQAKAGMSVLGTPEFMAPEMYEEKYDELVDIYAFGMCLLELVTCQFPYKECENAAQIYRKVSKGVAPQGLEGIREPHPRVHDFIRRCLAPRENRPSARMLLDSPFLDDTELSAPLPHSRRNTKDSAYSEFTSPLGSHSAEDLQARITDPVKHMQAFLDSQKPLERKGDSLERLDSLNQEGFSDDKVVKTVSEKQFGSSFRVSGESLVDGTLDIKVRMPSRTDPDKKHRSISFQFDPTKDTAKDVASEMAQEFSLGTLDETICAAAIQNAVNKVQGKSKSQESSPLETNGLDPWQEAEAALSRTSLDLPTESLVYPKTATENPMMDHFKALLENGEDSDVVVRAQNSVDFRAHKVILSARSTVLKAMLKDPQVKESGVLNLDIPPEVVRVVLFYIYTGSLPLSASAEIHRDITEMVEASNTLAMPRMKGFLEKFVKESKSMTR